MNTTKNKKITSAESPFNKPFEPMMGNRFMVLVDDIPAYIIKSIDRPKIRRKRTWYGRTTWKWLPMNLSAFNPVEPNGATGFMKHIESKKPFDFIVKCFDPVGTVIEEWLITGAKFDSVDFGSMSWAGSDPSVINATVKYKYATLKF